MAPKRNYAALFVCFVEATVLAGAFFGWPSLVYVLQEDGLYSHLCLHANSTTSDTQQSDALDGLIHYMNGTSSYTPAPETFTEVSLFNRTEDSLRVHAVRCTRQKVQLAVSFTVGIVTYGVGALPIGLFFDRFGLRTTRTVSVVLGVAAYIQLAFASQGTEWLIMTGAFCVGLSCYILGMTSCQVALLGGVKSSTITAIYMGGIDTSFAYQAVKMLHASGIPRFYSLIFIGCIWFLVLFSSWFLLPSFKVKLPSQKSTVIVEKDVFPENGMMLPDSTTPTQKIEKTSINEVKTAPSGGRLRHLLLSVTFVLFVFWFCAMHLRVNMMINGFDAWMTSVVRGDITKVSYFTDMMAYGTLLGTLTSPTVGVITDCMRSRYGSQPGGSYLVMIPAVTLTLVVAIAMTIPLLFSNEMAIYISLILFAIVKPFIYSTLGTYVGIVCPPEYFGLVFGISYTIAGVGSFMMYPYFMWVEAVQSFTPVNILILITLVLSLSLPLKLYHNRWQYSKSHQGRTPLDNQTGKGFL